MTIEAVLDLLGAQLARRGVEPLRAITKLKGAWLGFFGRDFLAKDIETAHLDAAVARWLKADYAPATINWRLKLLKRSFTLGLRRTPPAVRFVPIFPEYLPVDNRARRLLRAADARRADRVPRRARSGRRRFYRVLQLRRDAARRDPRPRVDRD
jgi:hypothetical protein